MRRWLSEGIWLLMVAFLVVTSGLFVFLVYKAHFEYQINLSHGVDSADRGMNLLGVVNFLAGTVVATVASFSLIFARNQIKHAEESRRASIYLELHNRFNEQRVRYAYRKIVAINNSYEAKKLPDECLSQYGHRVMLRYRDRHQELINQLSGHDTEYTKTLRFLDFLEDIGVLTARGYLKTDDLFDFMCNAIVTAENVLKDHIKYIRNGRKDEHIYANALALMKEARTARGRRKVLKFNEGEYRIPA